MKTFHHELLTGYTAAILEEIPAMVCDASRSSKSQENHPFHRSVWQGLKAENHRAMRWKLSPKQNNSILVERYPISI